MAFLPLKQGICYTMIHSYDTRERLLPSYGGLDVLAGATDKSHDTEHWIYPRWSGKEAAVAHEKALHAVDFSVFIGDRCFGVGSHAAGTHLVGGQRRATAAR